MYLLIGLSKNDYKNNWNLWIMDQITYINKDGYNSTQGQTKFKIFPKKGFSSFFTLQFCLDGHEEKSKSSCILVYGVWIVSDVGKEIGLLSNFLKRVICWKSSS